MNPISYSSPSNISQYSTEQLEQELALRQLTKNPRIVIDDDTTKCVISTVAGSNKIAIIANDGAVYWVEKENLNKLKVLIDLASTPLF
jgi:hypothetical protein